MLLYLLALLHLLHLMHLLQLLVLVLEHLLLLLHQGHLLLLVPVVTRRNVAWLLRGRHHLLHWYQAWVAACHHIGSDLRRWSRHTVLLLDGCKVL